MFKRYLQKAFLKLLNLDQSYPLFLRVANNLFSLPGYITNKQYSNLYSHTILQGIINAQVIPYALTRIWPFWVYQQLDPVSKGYSSNGFPFTLINTTQRNWTSISTPQSDQNGIIDPKGLITPDKNSWSLDLWIAYNSNLFTPAKNNSVEQSLSDDKSTVITKYKVEQVTVSSQVFFKQNKKINTIFNQVKVTNNSNEKINFSIFFAIRPYNPEGLSAIDEIVYITPNAFIIDGRLSLILDQKPDNIVCLKYKDGDVAEHFRNWEMILQAKCKDHLASAFAEYHLSLNPKEIKTLSCKLLNGSSSKLMRFFQKKLPQTKKFGLAKKTQSLKKLNFENEKESVSKYWQNNLKNLCEITLPNNKLEKCFSQNIAHLQNFVGKKNIYSGSFTYKVKNIKESIRTILALNRLGASELAHKSIELLLAKNNPFQILKQNAAKNNPDIYGQLIFILYDCYKFSKDKNFLEYHFPAIKNLVKKIQSSLVKNNQHPYIKGLIKKSYSCDNTGRLDYYMWDNFWALAGIKSAKSLAKVLNKEELYEHFSALEINLTNQIEKFISHISTLNKTTPYIPISQNRFLDSGLISVLIGVHPLNIIDPHANIISNTLTLIEKYLLVNNIFFNSTDHSGFHIAYNCQLAQVYLARQDQNIYNILNWLIKHISGTGSWPEAIHPHSLGGSVGDGHYSLATAEFLLLIRNMLVREEDNKTLHITPMLPKEWLNKNKPIEVKRIPTYFGEINFTLSSQNNNFKLNFDNKYTQKPLNLKLSLPYPFKDLKIDDKPTDLYNPTINIPPLAKNIKLTLIPIKHG